MTKKCYYKLCVIQRLRYTARISLYGWCCISDCFLLIVSQTSDVLTDSVLDVLVVVVLMAVVVVVVVLEYTPNKLRLIVSIETFRAYS